MAAPPPSHKDGQQTLRHAFDDDTGRFRVDANITAQDITVAVEIDAADDSIRVEDPDTGAHVRVELDGSINANVQVDAADGDNIAIHDSDGDELEIETDGSININDISGTISLPTGAATEAKQDVGNASLSSIDGKINNNYGAATGAIRTASQLGNTAGAADFNAGTTGAQTLRVSANITRNGTELSYNDGDSDANTQRVSSNLRDGDGTGITSQASGAQRALDVGINVSGVQVDPRLPYQGTLTDFSGTATGASTSILAANSTRKYLLIQNPTTNIIWINFGAAATNAPPSIRIAAGEAFVMEDSFISTEEIFVIRNAAVNVNFTGKWG